MPLQFFICSERLLPALLDINYAVENDVEILESIIQTLASVNFAGNLIFGDPHPHHMQLHNMLIIRHIYKILTLSGTFFGTLLA